MPNLRDKTWTTTTPANVEDAQFWENHLISDEDSTKLRNMEGVPSGGTAGQVLTRTTSTSAPIEWADPASSGHTIQDANGNVMPYQEILQFEGADVSNDATDGKTVVDCHGQKGDAATIQVGTVTTLPSGSPATVTNSGTSSAAVFDFGIPSGADGGSTIKVTTTETTLKGKNITLTGSTTLTATFDSNGVATFTGVTMTGTLTLYTSDGTSSATKAISVPYFGNYEETISFWSAIINVTATGINGVTVYAKRNGVTAASATVTNGSASLTVNSTGTYTIELTVNPGADDEYTYSESVTVSAESTYSVSLPIFITTLAISTTSTELYSQTITVTKGGSTVGTTAFSAQGAATFRVHETGTYTLTCTYSGDDYSSEITIVSGDNGQTKTISIETGLKLSAWLTEAGLDPSDYADFAAVEADEAAVRKLMTIHDAVDYLATAHAGDELMEDVINSDICAKWINLRDYALDKFYANSDIASEMDTAYKYFYGELALLPQVPVMTSDTTPRGTVIFDHETSGSGQAYYVFDGSNSTGWYSYGADTEAGRTMDPVLKYIGYIFTAPLQVHKVEYYIPSVSDTREYNNFTISLDYSDDGTTWTSQYSWEQTVDATTVNQIISVNIPNSSDHTYWRLSTMTGNGIGYYSTNPGYYLYFRTVQFYAYAPKGNVPIMTSDTAPYGSIYYEVTASTSGAAPYKAFDGDITTGENCYFTGTTTFPKRFGYKFAKPVCVKKAKLWCEVATPVNPTKWYIEGSNDGVTFTEIGYFEDAGTGAGRINEMDLSSNEDYYLWYVIKVTESPTNSTFSIQELQFYGREMKSFIPAMTSSTTPYGDVTSCAEFSDQARTYWNWEAVDNNLTSYDWFTPAKNMPIADYYFEYELEQPVAIEQASGYFISYNETTPAAASAYYDIKLQGYNGSGWDDVSNALRLTGLNLSNTLIQNFEITNHNTYKKYRIICVDSNQTYVHIDAAAVLVIKVLNFYGFDYSEYDWDSTNPRHYIYDHGVELDTVTITGTGSKGDNSITLSAQNAQAVASLDTTSYTAMGGKVGARASGTNQLLCGASSSNFSAANMPDGNGIDITNVNGTNDVGVKQTAAGTFDIEEVWVA